MPRPRRGFTLIELVLVIVVIGAMAVFALPRALDTSAWTLRSFADEVQSAMASAQRLALNQRREVKASLAATGVVFSYVATGATIRSLACPATVSNCIANASVADVTFNSGNGGSARTSTGSAITVTVTDGGSNSYAFQLENETGLMRRLP